MLLLSSIIGTLVVLQIIVTNPNHGLARFLSPDSMVIVMLVAIFTVRPFFGNRFELLPWYNLYLPSNEETALATAVGITCFAGISAGVFWAKLRSAKTEVVSDQNSFDSEYQSWSFGRSKLLVTTLLGLIIYVALLISFAGPRIVGQLNGGRSSEVALAGLPEFVLIIPLAGPVSSAIFILAAKNRSLNWADFLLVVASTAASAVMVSQLGTRRFIIPALLLPIIAALIRRPVRLKIKHILFGGLSIIFLAIVPMVRAAGARRAGENLATASLRYFQEEGVSGVLRPVFASYDTEMFDYIAVASRGLTGTQFGLGRGTLIEFATRPIPAFTGIDELFGEPFSDQMLRRLFGGGCGQPFCPVASLPGVLYFDGGFVFVFVGSVLAGLALRVLASRWVYNRGLSAMQMMLVVCASSFALVGARTNTIHTIWWFLYTLMIAYLILRLSGVKKGHEKSAVVVRRLRPAK